jgi:outer membrane receptor for ferrienterochelin and colicins
MFVIEKLSYMMFHLTKSIFATTISLFFTCITNISLAQRDIKIVVTNESKEPLVGVNVQQVNGQKTSVTNEQGLVLINQNSNQAEELKLTHIGYEEASIVITTMPLNDTILYVELKQAEEEEEEIVIESTRSSRDIGHTPTRTEVISGEELEEKANMKPGEIRMLLSESTGIQTQQTSATAYNYSIRIQGLDGRYTQLLKDGLPLYTGFSGGLSLMQVAPLDLKQVEVIKGSTSTLYGGGAIAGLINLVSRIPNEKRSLNFLANATSAGGLDLSGYYSERKNKWGVSLLASRNSSSPYDPAKIGFTAIPKFERYTANPRLFYFGNKTTLDAGFGITTENRIGGSIDFIQDNAAGYFEKNKSNRYFTQFSLKHKINEKNSIQFKNSLTQFERTISIPDYVFDGKQQSSFTELNWHKNGLSSKWTAGVNLWTDQFNETVIDTVIARDYQQNTAGLFIQNNTDINDKMTIESGMRADWLEGYGWQWLPRISLMYRWTDHISSRIGYGKGYKAPTIFTEETERIQLKNVLPINTKNIETETSSGLNADVNIKTQIGKLKLSINHLFFYTRLNNPLILSNLNSGKLALQNGNGHIDTKGMETNLKLSYHDFKLFVGYSYTDAQTHFSGIKKSMPLTPKHRLNNVLMYEIEEKWKVGLEAYYFSPQIINGTELSKSYWTAGFMAERIWEHFSVFVNFENFTDTRQTRFEKIYTGDISRPVFRDIYAPLEGFVVNGGIKLKW